MQVLTETHQQKHANTALVVQAMQDGSGGHGCKGRIVRDERIQPQCNGLFFTY